MNWSKKSNPVPTPVAIPIAIAIALVILGIAGPIPARAQGQQQAPAVGYMFPPGGQAGTRVDVVLGGYDWTPDIEVFVTDPRMQLVLSAGPGPILVPEPPYWFGKKARRTALPLPRQAAAQLHIPADVEPGIYRWQVANANGASATGRFVVSDQVETREQRDAGEQNLDSLPVTVSGQIQRIEEVDQYRFVAPRDGPITLSLVAAAIGSPLTAAIEVVDVDGHSIAQAADTEGSDLRLTFLATAQQPYRIRIYDVDFRGDPSFVYRLAFSAGPQVVATMPASGLRGQTRDVEFIGYGVATGAAELESITRPVHFPDQPKASFSMRLETLLGDSNSVALLLDEIADLAESELTAPRRLSIPSAVTGTLEQRHGTDRYELDGQQGDRWLIQLQAQAIGSQLDVALEIEDASGAVLVRVDDLPGSTDAAVEFTVPADGRYAIVVSDLSGRSGTRAATYRLSVRPSEPGFALSAPELVNLPIAGTATVAIQATHHGGFAEPISLHFEGLPEGVSVTEPAVIATGKNDAKVVLTATAAVGTAASLLRVTGRAKTDQQDVSQPLPPILMAVTMPPPFSVDAEGQDDVTKWPRGSTFPAPVLLQREEGFSGEVVLEMAAKQGRHRQGIRGPELKVPADVERVLYPVFLPPWLETTRTSRMVLNGVAPVTDPTGRQRYLSTKLKTRIGFLPTGALLTIACDTPEITAEAGQALTIPLTIHRAPELKGPAVVELVGEEARLTVADDQSQAALIVPHLAAPDAGDERECTVRATVMQPGQLPVVSETQVLIVFASASG